jgi:hypothetical protein
MHAWKPHARQDKTPAGRGQAGVFSDRRGGRLIVYGHTSMIPERAF